MLLDDQKIIACVDQSDHSEGVLEGAVWLAGQTATAVEFLHVLDRHLETAESEDLSGAIGFDAQEQLLENLSREDASKSKMAREHGRLFLSRLREHATSRGLQRMDTRQRHGTLTSTLKDLADESSAVVMGRYGESTPADNTARDISRTAIELVRTLRCPVLLTVRTFAAPSHVLFAFDGRSATRNAIRTLAASPLLKGLPVHVLMSGTPKPRQEREQKKQLQWAESVLAEAGFKVTSAYVPGDTPQVIAQQAQTVGADLLVMGVSQHHPVRHFLFGSNTNSILRANPMATLVLR